MTLLTTKNNALTLTLNDSNFPVVIETEITNKDGEKVKKEYTLFKTKSGGIAIASK